MNITLQHRAVSNVTFAVTAIVLLVIAGAGFGLYATTSASTKTVTSTSTQTMTESMSSTGTMAANATGHASPFTPAKGQMVSSAWLVYAPTGNGSYVLTVYASGLESPSTGGYLVEATSASGAMATAPISGNATTSEFETNSAGNGEYFIVLHQNPETSLEGVTLVYLPGMSMTNMTVIATASFSMTA